MTPRGSSRLLVGLAALGALLAGCDGSGATTGPPSERPRPTSSPAPFATGSSDRLALDEVGPRWDLDRVAPSREDRTASASQASLSCRGSADSSADALSRARLDVVVTRFPDGPASDASWGSARRLAEGFGRSSGAPDVPQRLVPTSLPGGWWDGALAVAAVYTVPTTRTGGDPVDHVTLSTWVRRDEVVVEVVVVREVPAVEPEAATVIEIEQVVQDVLERAEVLVS